MWKGAWHVFFLLKLHGLIRADTSCPSYERIFLLFRWLMQARFRLAFVARQSLGEAIGWHQLVTLDNVSIHGKGKRSCIFDVPDSIIYIFFGLNLMKISLAGKRALEIITSFVPKVAAIQRISKPRSCCRKKAFNTRASWLSLVSAEIITSFNPDDNLCL